MEIIINGTRAEVYTDYNTDFVKRMRLTSSAKWDGAKRCWTVDTDKLDVVRAAMETVYGYSDISNGEKITVKLTFLDDVTEHNADVRILGKTLSHATGRDSGAKPGNDVTFLSGEPTSGGSAKNWRSVVPAGAVVRLDNVSKSMFDQLEQSEDYTAEVVETAVPGRTSLLLEKERLLERLREIDKELEKYL